MIYWIIITIGILIMSISLSNPVYNISFNKYIKLSLFFQILIRILLFILSIIVILFGMYVESIF